MKAPTPLSQIDQNVVLPRAVREAAARTDALVAEIYPAAEPQPAAPAAEIVPVAVAPTPPAAPEPAPASPAEEPQNWEHMYKSLKGRFDRQAVQLTDLGARVDDLSRQPRPTPAPAPATTPTARLISEKEETEYGTEFLDVVGKRARDEVGTEVADLRSQVESLTQQVQGVAKVTTQTAQERLQSTMDAELPAWRTINTDPKFLAWLQLPDTFSGVTRQQLLMHAYERNETPRLLAFFNGFLSEEAAPAPPVTVPTPAAVTPPAGKVDLVNLAAPGRAKTAAVNSTTPAEKPIITTTQITKFYADVAAGKYRGREAEKDADEAMIFAAQADGRIANQ